MTILIIISLLLLMLIFFDYTGFLYIENSDYNHLLKEAELEGAESYEYQNGNTKAILFIHGFPGSPKMYYIVKELAIKAGYDVYIPRLPGFGTNEKEFISSNFSMWFNYIHEYYNNIRNEYDNFYIVGNSMGGALVLKLAECVENKPTAIASVAAPVFINSFFRGVVSSPFLYVVRFLSLFISYIPPKRPSKDRSLDLDGETEWVGYRGLFPKQTYSLLIGLKKIKKDLYKIEVPCYLCQAKMDKTVPYQNMNYIRQKISSDNVLVRVMDLSQWNHSNHSMFLYKSIADGLWSDIDSFFRSL